MKILVNKKLFILCLLFIMIISFLNMQNAKLLSSIYKYNLIKQIIFYLVGLLIFLLVKKLNIKALLNKSHIFYYFSLILLFLVLLFGKNINGAKAWFDFKLFAFQPSELAKLSLSLYLAKLASDYKKEGYDEKIFLLQVIIVTIIPSILVFLEPDTGAIIFYFLISLSILIAVGIKKRWFIILFIFLLIGITSFIILYIFNQNLLISLIGTSFFYRVERLISFKSNTSYQLENALIAIGSSKLFGTGLNKIAIYIPEAPTDFIFAFTISNFGIIVTSFILLSYMYLNMYLINKYFKTKNNYSKYVLASFITMFIFNQIINIGMNLGMLPIIGIPLPFLNYGGSTLIIYFLFLGIIFNNFFSKEKPYFV